MRAIVDLLRHERRAAVFFAAFAQSSLGTGAGYVALLLLAYDRYESAWAISAVLAADLVPAMFLGPLFGAAADRFSRKTCLVLADVIRAVAFLGIGVFHDFAATLALATLAGIGTGLFTPPALASLPALVEKHRLPAATALYGALADIGFTAGPVLAAALLLIGGADGVMLFNAATFAASAAVLATLRFGSAGPTDARGEIRPAAGLLRDAVEGLRAARAMPGLGTVLVASGAVLFFAGVFNVAELPFVEKELGGSDAAFALLVGTFGLGVFAGSVIGARGGSRRQLKGSYLFGLALTGFGLLLTGAAPVVAVAVLTFGAGGLGNGLMLVHERLLMQATVPDHMAGRLFGIKDSLTAWAFALAFIISGAVIELIGPRTAILGAGIGALLVWACAWLRLRRVWMDGPSPEASGHSPHALGLSVAGEDRSDLVRAHHHWLTLLDDLDEGPDDEGIELGPGISR